MKPTFTSQFLADLAQAYSSPRTGLLTTAFLADLSAAYADLESLPDLAWLSTRLDRWRETTVQRVQELQNALPEDDPGRCRISLFRPLGLSRVETAHTRTLAWLLDPKAEHGFGDRLLAALLREYRAIELATVDNVVAEFGIRVPGTGERGRFDVYATGTASDSRRWTLVIEAKIDAAEGERQLEKYDDWLEQFAAGHEIVRIFLTPNARAAETEGDQFSLEDVDRDDARAWQPLGYQELVQVFRTVYPSLRGTPGFDFLRYYLAGVLQDICGWRWPDENSNPFAALAYLQAAYQGANHDPAR